MENKVDFSIPPEIMADVSQKLNDVAAALQPYLMALSAEERMKLPKMSDKTYPFVEKTLDYTQSKPEFAPPYMDKQALADDMKVVEDLLNLYRTVKQLSNGLDDTIMQAGAESYMNALGYYNSVKQAAKMNVPAAKSVYDDLKKRFVK